MKFFTKKSLEAERSLAAIKKSGTAIMIADAAFNICFMNEAVTELLSKAEPDLQSVLPDFRVSDLIGASIDRFHKDPAHQRRMLGALKSTHSATIRLGSLTFDLAATPLLGNEGQRIGTTVEWADASIRLANIQFKAVFDAISRSQAVIEFEPNGVVVTANDNFLSAMGYDLNEIKGKHHRIFVESAYAASRDYETFWDDLRRGKFKAAEFKRLGKNSKEVWIQASYNPIFGEDGKVFKVVKFASDVTKAKLENVDLLGQIQAIHKSQAVIEFSLDGIILAANQNFLDLTGYSLADVQGRHHRIFVTEEDRDSVGYREFWKALGQGEYRAAQFRRVAKDGHEIYIQASYNAILDLDGKPWKVVKFAHDVTTEQQDKIKADRERGELISAVAAGAEELSSSVKEIAETMVKSRETANHAAVCVDQADRISQQFETNAQATAGIVDAIHGITDQINLLALNATIESARAGEAGRGFAVVASEVKNLANQAKNATEKITSEIDAMQTSSSDVIAALLSVKREIEAVQRFVSSTAAAVEEQSAVANELSATVQRAVSGQ